VAGTCGYGDGLSGFINAGNFLTTYKVYRLAFQEGLCSRQPDNMNVLNVESVRFLQIFLTVNYILKRFRNLRRLFMGRTSYEEKLPEEILRRKLLILWKSCSREVKR
jgi:hypothetical protein